MGIFILFIAYFFLLVLNFNLSQNVCVCVYSSKYNIQIKEFHKET